MKVVKWVFNKLYWHKNCGNALHTSMKTLFLVRHAEATYGSVTDKQRSLSSGGMIDAARMGKHCSAKLAGVQYLIASPAERTLMTAQVLSEQIGFDFGKVHLAEDLYEGSPRNYLATVNTIPEGYDQVMMIGHNPSITYLAEYLSHAQIGDMPTCGIVAIQFSDLKWTEVSGRTGKLLFFNSPDKLMGMPLD
jgi:phosphohistidine phosphatase